jgi:very-short-patch-repair endonuclease
MFVVEVDGAIHQHSRKDDVAREDSLRSLGLKVLRFKNHDVLRRSDEVLRQSARRY